MTGTISADTFDVADRNEPADLDAAATR